jgi:hypothetical protein
VKFVKADSRLGSRAQPFVSHQIKLYAVLEDVTSKNDGTQKSKVAPVATASSNTFAGVGTTGGEIGGKTASIIPVIAWKIDIGSVVLPSGDISKTHRPEELNSSNEIYRSY